VLSFRLAATALAGLTWTGMPALAQTQPGENQDEVLVIDGTVTIASDYRFRGQSLSDGDPALQGELTLSHRSGVYGSVWASTIAENDGADVETGFAIGLNKQIGSVQLDGSLFYYAYPGAGEANYFEALGRASVPLGKGEWGIGYAFAPGQRGTGGQANHYVNIDVEVPIGEAPITLGASLGLEQGAFGNGKIDWSFGASRQWRPFKVEIRYFDSARGEPGSRKGAALVVSLSLVPE